MAIGEVSDGPYVTGTTRGLPCGQDYDHFCDSIADLYVGVRPERPKGGFAADYALYDLGEFALGLISTPGTSAHRDRASIARLSDDAVFVNHSRRAWALDQRGRNVAVAPGSAVILDNARPFSVLVDPRRRLDLTSVRIPRERLGVRAANAIPTLDARLSNSPRGTQVGAQIALLASAARDGLSSVAVAMGAAVVEMLDAFAADDALVWAPTRAETYRIHARTRLHDSSFDLASLARAFGCSSRTVQTAFAREGERFSEWLRGERLDGARAALRSPANAGTSLAVVARDHGFADVGTFHRAYTMRFGITPHRDR